MHAVCAPRALGAGAAAPKVETRVDPAGVLTAHVADYPTVQALRWMGDMISRESGGVLSIRVYHSGQLVVAYVPALSLWLPGVLRAAG